MFDQPTAFSYIFLPVIVSVACPTGPHPPLRLARRPNRVLIGGGGWTPSCGTADVETWRLLWCECSQQSAGGAPTHNNTSRWG